MGMTQLKNGPYAAAFTDKDGGYCLVEKGELALLHQEALSKTNYLQIPTWDGIFADPMRRYAKICGRIASLDSRVCFLDFKKNIKRY